MFSGITRGLYKVVSLNKTSHFMNYIVNFSTELCNNLHTGDSVSIDGVCQTVVKIIGTNVFFQAIDETLSKTTLSELQLGSYVSIERSLSWGDANGGHEVSGHVFGTGIIYAKIVDIENLTLIIQCQQDWMKYILEKGFIAIDGSSLTIGKTEPKLGLFYIHLIPETLKLTKFTTKQISDKVNIEFDYKTKVIVDTTERLFNSLTSVTCFHDLTS